MYQDKKITSFHKLTPAVKLHRLLSKFKECGYKLEFKSGKFVLNMKDKIWEIGGYAEFKTALATSSIFYYKNIMLCESDTEREAFINEVITTCGTDVRHPYWNIHPILQKGIDMYNESVRSGNGLPPLPMNLSTKALIFGGIALFYREESILMFLYGTGGSGKSTFANILRWCVGGDASDTSYSSLQTQFGIATMISHRLNICDESSTIAVNDDLFKRLANYGSQIAVEPKFMTGYSAVLQTRVIFTCNTTPILDFTDTGITRRVIYYEYEKEIDRNWLTKTDEYGQKVNLSRYIWTEEESVIFSAYFYKAFVENKDKFYEIFKNETIYALLNKDNVFSFIEYCNQSNKKWDFNFSLQFDGKVGYEGYRCYCRAKGKREVSEDTYLSRKLFIQEKHKYYQEHVKDILNI